MKRIPDEKTEHIKRETDLVALVAARRDRAQPISKSPGLSD